MAVLPSLYQFWIGELLSGRAIPPEKDTDCARCPLISPDVQRNKSDYIFNSDTKCCTYWPDIPNFLVGRILKDDPDDALKRRFGGSLVTPLGAHPTAGYLARYSSRTALFGQDRSLLCPYFASGNCGIWNNRISRCATWFCRYNRGSVGVVFWKYMGALLHAIERTLARWCILKMNLESDALRLLFPPPPSERLLEDVPRMWGRWIDNKETFFLSCAEMVEKLNWRDVRVLCGPDVPLMASLVCDSYEQLMNTTIPDRLIRGEWKTARKLRNNSYRIWTYNRYDPVDISPEMYEVLVSLEGSSTVETIRSNSGLELSDDRILEFVDRGVLAASRESLQQITV